MTEKDYIFNNNEIYLFFERIKPFPRINELWTKSKFWYYIWKTCCIASSQLFRLVKLVKMTLITASHC